MAKRSVARLRAVPKPRVCEKHHPFDYAEELNEIRQRLRVLRLALGGGAVLDKLQGCEPLVGDAAKDGQAVREFAEEIERRMDDFTEERERCPVCSPGVA